MNEQSALTIFALHAHVFRSDASPNQIAAMLLPVGLELLVIFGWLAYPLGDIPCGHTNATLRGVRPLSGGFLPNRFAYRVHAHGAFAMPSKPILNRCCGGVPQRTRPTRLRLLHDWARRFFRNRAPDHDQDRRHDQYKLHTP